MIHNVETANVEGRSGVADVIARAPDHVRQAINRRRATSGLPAVPSARDLERLAEARLTVEAAAKAAETRGTGVWLTGPDGRLVPVSSRNAATVAQSVRRLPSRSAAPARPTSRSSTTTATYGTRVLLLAAYGDASPAMVRGPLPETIAPTAFGPASDLNDRGTFDLRYGHRGPRLAIAGERLRAHDTPAGLVVEWIVDHRAPLAGDVLRAIEAGAGVSVGFHSPEVRTVRLPRATKMIVRAVLDHVAVLTDDTPPAYPAATAMLFRSARLDDAEELRRHIDKVVAEARFRARRSRGW